jgi:general secretion pathway protein G
MTERRQSGKAGFTLIEILLVVVIIGILAALVGPRLVGRAGDAERTAARSDIATIESAIAVYEMDMGVLPPSLDALMNSPGGERWKGPYLSKPPIDPWGNAYIYNRQDRSFSVTSSGLNTQEQ